MDKTIKIIVLEHQNLISEIEEHSSELGEPDCLLIKPYLIKDDKSLEPFLNDFTDGIEFMISSDKILTLAEPSAIILKQYQDLTKE